MKLAPSLQQAYIRRHWLLATGIVENILFSAVLLGWPALVSVLKNEGYYAQLCSANWEKSLDRTVESTRNQSHVLQVSQLAPPLAWSDGPPPKPSDCCPEMTSCAAQEKKLNLCFTVGCFMLSALTLPICVASDKLGVKWMRVVGGCLVSVSAVLFACSSAKSPNILFFTCALNGIGGNIVAYTSLQISNLFGPLRTLTLGLLVGSYAAAAIVFPTMKVLYALGISLQMLFISMAVMSFGIVINAWVNLPLEPISQTLDLTRETKSPSLSGEAGEKDSCSPQSDVGVKLTEPVEDFVMPLHRVVFMPLYIWSIVIISVTQLRLLFFVGDLQHLLVQMTPDNPETVDLYIFIFGILQICCLGTTHFIDGFVEWRSKKTNCTSEDTHLLGRPSSQAVRVTKPIPPSSTTTSFLAEKAESSETVVPSAAVPEADSLLPLSVSEKLPVPNGGGSGVGVSESSFNVRKTSLLRLVQDPEADGQSESQTMTVLPSPEKRPPAKTNKGSASLNSGAKDLERKIQRLQDCAVVFFVTSTLTVIFGLLVLIPALTIQISTFVCYTLIRGFVPCAVGRLYGVAFHAVHHQALIGLAFLVSSLFSVAQHPLLALVVDYYQGDPYWVNVGLLFLSLLSFGLPIHLVLHCQHLEEWRKATAGPPQPVLIKMQYLDTKLTSRGTPAEL